MPEWIVVVLAGAIGGFANWYLSSAGGPAGYKLLPERKGEILINPGILGSVLVGAIAGLAFWDIYDPQASFYGSTIEVHPVVGALLAGVAGGKLLINLVDLSVRDTTLAKLKETLDDVSAALVETMEQLETKDVSSYQKDEKPAHDDSSNRGE